MSLRRRPPTTPAPQPDDHLDRLSRIRPRAYSEDEERPSAEDLKPQMSQFFTSAPVPLPRFLQSRRERKRNARG
jgi:hypothetical protein